MRHDHLPAHHPRPVHPGVLDCARDCYGGIAVMDISEADAEDYRRQDREDKGIAHLEERRRREPPIGEPCEVCDGAERVYLIALDKLLPTGDCVPHKWSLSTNELPDDEECPRCLGTGVQP